LVESRAHELSRKPDRLQVYKKTFGNSTCDGAQSVPVVLAIVDLYPNLVLSCELPD